MAGHRRQHPVGEGGGEHLGDAKVEELGHTLLVGEQDVAGLEIAVDHQLLMR